MRALGVPFGLIFAALVPFGCGPDPEGVEDCRAIEAARCRAATECGVIDDADGCERFYRDHCLHGFSVDAPGGPVVEACIEAIEAAPGEDLCDAVLEPARLGACSFLDPDAEPAEPGTAGAGGTEGSAGETSSEPEAGAPSADDAAGAGGSGASG